MPSSPRLNVVLLLLVEALLVGCGGILEESVPDSDVGSELVAGDECNYTSECKTKYGAAATDCRDSRSSSSVCLCGAQPCVDEGPEPEPATPFSGRLAYAADGNYHDKDDLGATPMALALLAKAGLQARVVYVGYNNHLWETNVFQQQEHAASVEGALARFGYPDASVAFDVKAAPAVARAALVAAINASSEASPLHLVLAGPMEHEYQALHASDPARRRYVTVYSHSSWNDNHGDLHNGHTWRDVLALGVRGVHLVNQNTYAFGARPQTAWTWLQNGDDRYDWLYTRLRFKDGDASDAGMVWYLIKRSQTPSMSQVRTFFGL